MVLVVIAVAALIFPLPPQKQAASQASSQAKKYLGMAIYRYWSDAVPYCEQYFQFTNGGPLLVKSKDSLSADKWQRLHLFATSRIQEKQACRHNGKPVSL